MIPVEQAHLKVAAGTHEGMRGKNNEDLFAVASYMLSAEDQTPVLFAMIADGVGGHLAGEVASKIAVEMVSEAVARSDGSQPTAIMEAAIIQASNAIFAQSQNDEAQKGMGTTAVCAWIIEHKLYVASVGNSRIYLLRDGQLIQMNIDHTWVQEAVDAGALTPMQARNHPHSNVIRRHLGSRHQVEVDLRLRFSPEDDDQRALNNQGAKLRAGDRLILCSDGLNDMVLDEDILAIASGTTAEEAVQQLIEKANENGGKDNITVIVIDMPKGFRIKLPKLPFDKLAELKPSWLDLRSPLQIGILLASVLVLISGLIFLGWWGWRVLFGSSRIDAAPTTTPEPLSTLHAEAVATKHESSPMATVAAPTATSSFGQQVTEEPLILPTSEEGIFGNLETKTPGPGPTDTPITKDT